MTVRCLLAPTAVHVHTSEPPRRFEPSHGLALASLQSIRQVMPTSLQESSFFDRTEEQHFAIVCFKCACCSHVATLCPHSSRKVNYGNCGTSVTTPFVLTPSGEQASPGEREMLHAVNGAKMPIHLRQIMHLVVFISLLHFARARVCVCVCAKMSMHLRHKRCVIDFLICQGVCRFPFERTCFSECVYMFTANLRTKIMDFRGFDSSIILILWDGILMSIGSSL